MRLSASIVTSGHRAPWGSGPGPGALAALALLFAACHSPESDSPARYNLLLISVDSLRTDHIAASGYPRDTTPVLDAFLAEGTWFADATSAAPWTTPSMMTVMTGLDPEAHRVQAPQFTLAPEAETLAERLQAAGYRTMGVVPAVTLGPHFGFYQGFDEYRAFNFGHFKLTSRQLNAEANRLLSGAGGERPWFLWLHYWDPHYNYNPPEPEASRYPSTFRPEPGTVYNVGELKRNESPLTPEEVEYLVTQYDGEIRYTDRFVGELLRTLRERGEEEKTLVVLLADHGEAFQEHGWLGHTNRVDETLVRVPLAFRLPGVVRSGQRVDLPVGLVDLLPTVLDLLGLPHDETALMGHSLAPTLRDGVPPETAPLASETVRRGAWYALRQGSLKYLLDFATCSEALFDLASDPGETQDQSATRPEDLASLRRLAAERLHRSRAAALREVLQEDNPAVLEQLRGLGYLPARPGGDLLGDPHAETTDLRPGRCFGRDPR